MIRKASTTGLALGGVKRTYKTIGEAREAYKSGIKSNLTKDFTKKAIKRDQTATLKDLYKRRQGVAYKKSLGSRNQTVTQVAKSQNLFNKRQAQIPLEQRRARQRLNQRARLGKFSFSAALAEFKSNYSNPGLRERLKNEILRGSKGGNPGQWSARKAQLLALRYKKSGGGYKKGKAKPQKSLDKWTKQKWRTKSGKPSLETGERYLPSKAIDKMSPQAYGASTRAKRQGMKKGMQFVPQPPKAKTISKRYRK